MINFFKKSNNLLFITLILLTIINILQSYTTELLSDEAYYWVYRQHMDWGYFDHPPMVAVWIWISNLFVETGELSVRFFSAFTFSATIYIIWKLINHNKKKEFTWLFLLIVLSTVLFTVYGFITVPDTPLLFFMGIFLLGYKKYLQEKSLLSYIIISVSMTGMLYSKYQGILIILFVLLSNLKVLKDYKIWLASLGTLILFFPHLYWQYANDYPTFRYHLFERSSISTYKLENTILHIVNSIAIIGLTFPIVYKALFNNLKNKDLFNKALNFISLGFIVFFFFMTFKGHVQAQWIVPISIPLIIITFNYLTNKVKQRKIFITLAVITIGIVGFLRIFIANDILPIQLDFHNNRTWVKNLEKELNGEQPVFLDSYQNASTYWFYSKKQPCEYNTWWGRKNQYDLLESNIDCEASEIAIIVNGGLKNIADTNIGKRNNSKLYIQFLDDYSNLKRLKVNFLNKVVLTENSINSIEVILKNPYNKPVENTLKVKIVFRNKSNKFIKIIDAKILYQEKIILGENKASIVFNLPKELNKNTIDKIQIVGQSHPDLFPFRLSKIETIEFLN